MAVKVFFDVETTGVNFRQHSIIELSGAVEVDGQIKESFEFFVRPHAKAKIEEKALEINRTTLDQIKAFPEMKAVLREFKSMLKKYIDPYNPKQKAYLIGFNNRFFDDPFLRKFFELCGDDFIGSWFWADSIDVLCLASEYLIDRRVFMPNFKLKRVAMELGLFVEVDRLHAAGYDVELTRKVYRIVTGLEKDPSKAFYFYFHPPSGRIWKTLEQDTDDDTAAQELCFLDYRAKLLALGLKDGPDLINDDLF
jgi:DNA polymerase-3 subunit epsilon